MWNIRELAKAEFPPLLDEIADPPKSLYLAGELPSQKNYRYLTVVGSRKFSSYGKEACESLIHGLAGYPVVIVSGLALGIDSIAHRSALEAGLRSIGVPGSGLSPQVLYPRTNLNLAKDVLDRGGALLSEFPPETRAALYTFPQRNRIMAGISHATLLVEAGEKSGTLITARLASDYNRELLVVPGSIFSLGSRGTHQFLRLGATPVTESAHIIEALGLTPEASPERVYHDLSPEELRIVEILSIESLPRDELIARLSLPTHEANVLLSTTELKGITREILGEIHLV